MIFGKNYATGAVSVPLPLCVCVCVCFCVCVNVLLFRSVTYWPTFSPIQAEHPTGDDMNSGLYEAMRKELRHAVEEIKMELEHVCFCVSRELDLIVYIIYYMCILVLVCLILIWFLEIDAVQGKNKCRLLAIWKV